MLSLQTLRYIDCCGLLDCCVPRVPPLSDHCVPMDRSHDQQLHAWFSAIEFCDELKQHNPLPCNEERVLRPLSPSERGDMLMRNAHLLSKVFIHNANACQLAECFRGKTSIRILDVGCGYSLSLLGILAYFGSMRLEYLGIDIDQSKIAACQQTYSQFPMVRFSVQDAKALPRNESFDLVLIQHPYLVQYPILPNDRALFKDFFGNAHTLLTKGGRLYSTFYYQSEADYFKREIVSNMVLQGELKKNDCYKTQLYHLLANECYVPENYSFLSSPA